MGAAARTALLLRVLAGAYSAEQIALAQELYDAGEHTVQQIAGIFNVPRTTVYGHLGADRVGARPTLRRAASDP